MQDGQLSVNLKGKTALVTGGAKGLGEAIATALAANGAAVAVNYLTSEKKANGLVVQLQKNGGEAIAVRADVSVQEDVEQMFGTVKKELGSDVDILVNNAGGQVGHSTIEDMPLDLWNRVLEINLTGPMICSKFAIPGMKKKGKGRIINISSISARTGGGPYGVPYVSGKGGLSAFTKALAKELGSTGITVNAVAPGVVPTEQHEKFSTKETLEFIKKLTPLGRLGEPEEIAGAVLFLASDSASYVTGELIAVNGGLRMD